MPDKPWLQGGCAGPRHEVMPSKAMATRRVLTGAQCSSIIAVKFSVCMRQGTMVAGYDPTGPGLYYVDSDGQRTKGSIFSVGSGSLYAYGVLDNGYKWCARIPTSAMLPVRLVIASDFQLFCQLLFLTA